MAADRRLRILALLRNAEHTGGETKRLCHVCAEVTGSTGAGIMLMSGDVPRGSICTTDDVSARLERLQDTLGEGPCVDAHRGDRTVLEPDLAHPRTPRWPAFTGPALATGAHAVFGFPLQIGSVRLGSLNLYRDQPGRLDDEQHADALVVADIAAQSLLLLQAEAPPGRIAAELEVGAEFQYLVHQAAGMVAAQLAIPVRHTLVRLRGHAFANDRDLVDVARSVVARELRFDPHGGESRTTR